MTFKRPDSKQAAIYKIKLAIKYAPGLAYQEKWAELLTLTGPLIEHLNGSNTYYEEQAELLMWTGAAYAALADFDKSERMFRKAYEIAQSMSVKQQVQNKFNEMFTGELG